MHNNKGIHNPMFGKHHTDATKEKISRNHHFSDEGKERLRQFHLGYRLSEEAKEKCRQAMLGNKHTFGKHPTEEARAKMSQAQKNRLRRLRIPEGELRHKYIDLQLSTPELARKFSCASTSIINYLKEYGIPRRGIKEASNTLQRITRMRERIKGNTYRQERYTFIVDENDLRRRYLDLQQSTPDIAKVYGCSKPTILDRLKGCGIPIRAGKEAHNVQPYLELHRRRWADRDDPKFIEMRRKMIVGLHLRPNKPETVVLNLLNILYPNEWTYTGDGQVIIGGLNPDFFNTNGKKLIIEVFGDYWHTQKFKPYRINEGRVDVYAKYGYRTLIIWEREIKDIPKLTERVKEFVK